MKIKVRVATSEGPETALMKLAGISAVAHLVGLIVVSIVPRLMTPPPQRIPMVAEIVPASALNLPSSPQPTVPSPPGRSPTERAIEARKAQQKPPDKPVEKPPPKPPKKDATVPPLESRKDAKKKPPEKTAATDKPAVPPGEETLPAGADVEAPPQDPDPGASEEQEGPDPGAGISFGPGSGFDASGVPMLGSSAFPYDYYRSSLMTLLQSNWRRPVVTDVLGEPLRCGIGFTILKSGIVKDAHVADPSGNPGLDRSALRAVIDSNPLPPLPFQYGHDAVSAVVYFKLTGD